MILVKDMLNILFVLIISRQYHMATYDSFDADIYSIITDDANNNNKLDITLIVRTRKEKY